VLHAVDFRRIGVDALRRVAQHGPVLPAAFPQLVDHFHELVRDVVAGVVRALLGLAHALGRAVQVTGDDVPAHAAVRQVIERGREPRERVRVEIGNGSGDAEAEVLGDRRHRRHDGEGVIGRHLHAGAQRRLRRAAVDVVHAGHVGEEDAVEKPALERAREILPVGERGVTVALVPRMPPQSVRLVARGVHVEGVEENLLAHRPCLPARWRVRCCLRVWASADR